MRWLAVLALVLAACGGGEDQATTTTTAVATTTTAATATIEQYASLVAEHRTDLTDSIETVSPCFLGPSTRCGISASITATSVWLQAQTFVLSLQNAFTKTSKVYIGPPPAEIADLVERTVVVTLDLQTAQEEWADKSCGAQPGAPATPADDCMDVSFLFGVAADDLSSVLNAWEPYL